ncbi:MAG: GntR family transcriptional regulator [Burkholderiaceae bacterium]|nr:GntR family transcriptional regulator [Burkholderiaceae bacterium]
MNTREDTPPKTPESTPSAVQRVVDLVLARIRSGEYAPGQIIVARDLMAELELSKAPVREGIHVLVGEGLIELLPNRSARIRKLSDEDMVDFSEVWAVISGMNIRLAAAKLQRAEDREKVRQALARIQATRRTRIPYDFFMAVGKLHATLAEISGNGFALAFIRRMHLAHFYRHIERVFPGSFWNAHLLAFRRLGEALLAQDGDRAERIYLKHMRWAIGLMRQRVGTGLSV